MRSRTSIINPVVITLVLFAITGGATGQDAEQLINQLKGKAEAPQRNAEQLTSSYQKAIDYLLPLMSSENVGSRYNYQISLQNICAYASRPGAELERQTLAKVIVKTLDTDMPDTVRHWLVLQLERIGKGESVPGLAKLLSNKDENLRDYARRALEKNPDPSATDVLLKELSAAKEPKWKIGLINALGTRGTKTAVKPIAQALGDQDLKVADAAVTALSNIGDEDCAQALFGVLEKPAGSLYMKAAQGLIDIAQKRASHKDNRSAAKIYEALYDRTTKMTSSANIPSPLNIRIAALNGLIICNPERGTAEIVNLIQDNEPKIRTAAVAGAHLASSNAPTQALGKMLPKLQPDSQVQVLGLIGDRRDASLINSVKAMLDSNEQTVRLAAIDALSKIGSDATAKILLTLAINGDDAAGKAAQEGLVVMAGTGIEDIIKKQADTGDVKARVTAINILGQRRMYSAAKNLFGYAAEDNEEICAAAFSALAYVVNSGDIANLVELIVKTKNNAARQNGITALKAALAKAKDKDAAAKVIIDKMTTSGAEIKLCLLSSLNALGGSTALKTVTEASQSSDQATREVGIRTLSDWPDYEAAEILLNIASKTETIMTHHVLAIRGAIHLIQTSTFAPIDNRITLCLSAFDHARRDEEKKQAISAMGSLPSSKTAERLLELVKDERFKTEAGLACVELAGNMLMTDRQAARDLAQKIRDLNISDETNFRADWIISGRGMMRGRGRRQ